MPEVIFSSSDLDLWSYQPEHMKFHHIHKKKAFMHQKAVSVIDALWSELLTLREKGIYLTNFYDKNPYTNRKLKNQRGNTKM